jgi:hypothetical protein
MTEEKANVDTGPVFKVIEVDPPPTGDLVLTAIQKGYQPEFIEKMMDLQERHEANEARKAYNDAMSQFKEYPPKILKDKKVGYDHKDGGGSTNYSYAGLAQIAELIGRALSKHGLSATWTTKQEGNNITVTCVVTHRMGHSESTSLTAAPDASGKKNSIQAIGSTISYLEKYTLLAITGTATHDMDDDGLSSGKADTGPTPYEQWEIKCNEAGEAARSVEEVTAWWSANGDKIKKELKTKDAAMIHNLVNAHKNRIKVQCND